MKEFEGKPKSEVIKILDEQLEIARENMLIMLLDNYLKSWERYDNERI